MLCAIIWALLIPSPSWQTFWEDSMSFKDWVWKHERWFPQRHVFVRWKDRSGLKKPDVETELPQSNEEERDEAAAIERERQQRLADRQDYRPQ